jgi:hypothetical protein
LKVGFGITRDLIELGSQVVEVIEPFELVGLFLEPVGDMGRLVGFIDLRVRDFSNRQVWMTYSCWGLQGLK